MKCRVSLALRHSAPEFRWWKASCPNCGPISYWPSLPHAYSAAAGHRCRWIGPRRYAPDTTIAATEGSTAVYAEDPRQPGSLHRLEVWL